METELSLRKRLDGLAESSRYDSAEFCAPPVAPIETSAPADAPQLSQHTDLPSQRSVGSDSAEFCAPPMAPIETSAPADAPQLSQHTDVSSQRSIGSDSAEFWASPAARIKTSPPANAKVSVPAHRLYMDENDWLQLSQDTDLSPRSLGAGRKLITGIAVVLALLLSALAYFFLASPSEKSTTQTAELAPSVPYPPATPAEAALSAAPAAAAPSAAPAVTANAAPEPAQAAPKVARSGDVLYLQRAGVNIRSTPSPTGSAVGTAPKGTRFKVTNRQGDWIQVEKGRLKGWINAGFLAPSEPR